MFPEKGVHVFGKESCSTKVKKPPTLYYVTDNEKINALFIYQN